MEVGKGIPSVCVIGSTGTGKSALCNTLSGDHLKTMFSESATMNSQTYATRSSTVDWFGMPDQGSFDLIDSPGLGDTRGQDTQHIANMISHLKARGSVNAFCIVFNGQNPRMDEHLQAMLKIFAALFGTKFLENTCIVFTRWGWSKKDVYSRKMNGDTEENKKNEVQNWFSKLFAFDTHSKPIQCYFIDNGYNVEAPQEVSEDAELERFNQELKKLQQFIKYKPPLVCKDIQLLSEKEMLLKQINDLVEENKAKELEWKRQMNNQKKIIKGLYEQLLRGGQNNQEGDSGSKK